MKTAWFTFGQSHVHSVEGKVFDKDTVVQITADDPRERMIELFGLKWAFEYDKKPAMELYKEIVDI